MTKIDPFAGWIHVIDEDRLTKREETQCFLALSDQSRVTAWLGKYGNVPVKIVAHEKFQGKLYMQAHGINRTNRKANAKRLAEVLKYEEKKDG